MLLKKISTYQTKFMLFFLAAAVAMVFTAANAKAELSAEADFAELYAQIIRAVETGKLDDKIGKEARKLNFSLQKDIFAVEDKIEAIKSKSAKLNNNEHNDAMEELINYGMKKERIYNDYKQRLSGLVGAPAAANMATGKLEEKPLFGTEAPGVSAFTPGGQIITVESVPENVGDSNFD